MFLQETCSVSRASDLPAELLAGVLLLVQPRDRLCLCALVCRNWRRAANMTVSTINITANSEQVLCSLSDWLSNNSSSSTLQSVTVDTSLGRARPVLRLPIYVLRQVNSLTLSHCHLKVAMPQSTLDTASAAGGITTSPQPFAAPAALSRLDLRHVLLDFDRFELTKLTGLQYLRLSFVDHLAAEDAEEGRYACRVIDLPPHLVAALSHFTQLKHLTLDYSDMPIARSEASPLAASLGSLHQLQELRLSSDRLNGAHLSQLPTSLTLLQLDQPLELTPVTVPGLTQLTQLQHLQLHEACSFSPALLSSWPRLTYLSITSTELCSPQDIFSAVRELMTALGQLTGLQHLDLAESITATLATDSAEVYSALTASSHLTELRCKECCFTPGSFQHIFRSSSPCQSLKAVTLPADLFSADGSFDSFVTCCPALQRLKVIGNSWMEVYEIDLQVGFQIYSAG